MIRGFEIPSLAVQGEEARRHGLKERFRQYLSALHAPDPAPTYALVLSADPRRTRHGARVRATTLVRSEGAAHFEDALALFPNDRLSGYGTPRRLEDPAVLRDALLADLPAGRVRALRLERRFDAPPRELAFRIDGFGHPFFAAKAYEPWEPLVEAMGGARRRAALVILVTPMADDALREEVADAHTHYRWTAALLEQMRTGMASGATGGDNFGEIQHRRRMEGIMNHLLTGRERGGAILGHVDRGAHAFGRLFDDAERLFEVQVALLAEGEEPWTLAYLASAALCAPDPDRPEGRLGWSPPTPVVADPEAIQALEPLAERSIRNLAPVAELVDVFRPPTMRIAGQSSWSPHDVTPFVLPPSVAEIAEDGLELGFVFQRDQCLDGEEGRDEVPFVIGEIDLMKPSLLAGAPGSGKSNLALGLLAQFHRRDLNFLVLDPSTGQEYRDLLGDGGLRESLVVFGAGERSAPFASTRSPSPPASPSATTSPASSPPSRPPTRCGTRCPRCSKTPCGPSIWRRATLPSTCPGPATASLALARSPTRCAATSSGSWRTGVGRARRWGSCAGRPLSGSTPSS